MENDLLKKFIFLVGAALEEEDRIILGRTLIRGKPRGILHLVDERYYQRICWKAAMTRWDAHIERASYDLSLHSPDETEKCFAVFEMKLWMSSRGEQEIPKIKKDIEKLRPLTDPVGFLIVFAANPASEKMHDQLQWLEKGIFEAPVPPHEVYSFPTLFKGKPGRVLGGRMASKPPAFESTTFAAIGRAPPSPGSSAMFAAMLRASSCVSNLAADRRPARPCNRHTRAPVGLRHGR